MKDRKRLAGSSKGKHKETKNRRNRSRACGREHQAIQRDNKNSAVATDLAHDKKISRSITHARYRPRGNNHPAQTAKAKPRPRVTPTTRPSLLGGNTSAEFERIEAQKPEGEGELDS